jgi:antitoxin (DNA-binding transcriptional repressor) of toxin-antitoxin stability system
MTQLLLGQAKTHLSSLLKRIEAGEEVTVASRGKAIATLELEPP